MQQLIKQFSCQNLQNKWKGEIRLDQYNSPVGVGFDELESGNAIVGAFVSVAVGVNQVVDTYG